jgi:hypothetical protein
MNLKFQPMKTRPWILIPITLLGFAATAQPQNAPGEPAIVERGAHHRVWEQKKVRTLPMAQP